MALRVLVTRPQPGASRTAARLTQSGYEAIILPLSETVPLAAKPVDPVAFDAVAVTSANAIRHASRDLLSGLLDKPVFAVGARTAAACRAAGFSTVVEGDGDAAGLARLLAASAKPASSVLYLCGTVRRPDFEAALAQAKIPVTALEVYDTLALSPSENTVRQALGNKAVTDVLVFSPNAAQSVSALVGMAGLATLFAPARYICMSERVSMALAGIESNRRPVASTPDEPAMFALLDQQG